ncbi:MAG TPA: gamma-glutamyl-gamma-aminobutyrate hydrolase family protein, partial [Polaromonas sp.]|nr:gamma-glutamyl-gamma-aminobutyrate hydrolase family protein [Polaromonas sp.]
SKSYIAALQWHPEFHQAGSDTIDDGAVLNDFLTAVAAAKDAQSLRQKTLPLLAS